MVFGIKKCATLSLNRRKVVKTSLELVAIKQSKLKKVDII